MPSRNEITIIAAFRSTADAQAAATDLQAAGISRDDIYIEGSAPGEKSQRSKAASSEGGITGWFKSIFGDEEDVDRSEYEQAITKGYTLLRVDVDEEEIATVEDILNRHSPVEVHAQEGSTRTGGEQ